MREMRLFFFFFVEQLEKVRQKERQNNIMKFIKKKQIVCLYIFN